MSFHRSLRDCRKQREKLLADADRQQKRKRLVGRAAGHGEVPRRVLPQQEPDPLPRHEEVDPLGLVRLPGVVVRHEAQVRLVRQHFLPCERQDLEPLAWLRHCRCCCEVTLEVDEEPGECPKCPGQVLVVAATVFFELWWVVDGTENGWDQMLRAVCPGRDLSVFCYPVLRESGGTLPFRNEEEPVYPEPERSFSLVPMLVRLRLVESHGMDVCN